MTRLAALAAIGWLGALGACRGEPSTTTLALRVTAEGAPSAARVLLVKPGGEPLRIGTIDLYGARQGATACRLARDAVGTWGGIIVGAGAAEVPVGADGCTPSPAIPYGRYRVIAWRGIDFERWEGEVDLSAERGRVELAIELERAWTAPGTLAADLHVHARASNDSTMPDEQRVLAQVAAGIQVSAATNHDVPASFEEAIRALGLEHAIAALPAIELSADALHVNAYPVPLAPPPAVPPASEIRGADAARLFALARGLAPAGTPAPIVQLNHPRFRVTALYDGARWDGRSWPPPFPPGFDAVEVINGFTAFNAPGDRRLDDSVRDLHTLVDHGWLVAPVGNSDTHDFNWVHDGLARTLVVVPDARTAPFDAAAFTAAIRARRTVATTCPWLEVAASPREGGALAGPGEVVAAEAGAVWLRVTVARARFCRVDRLAIAIGTPAGPSEVRTVPVPADERAFTWSGAVEVGPADTWIGVTAAGDAPLPIEQTGTYQPDKWRRAGNTPFAVASPVLVDADGDGRWRRGDADVPRGGATRP